MDYDHETMQRRMNLSDEEFVRVALAEDSAAKAARRNAPRSTSSRGLVGKVIYKGCRSDVQIVSRR